MRPTAASLLGLAFLCLVANAQAAEDPAQLVYTNKARFRIPYKFDAAEAATLGAREIRLYVSVDQGASWHHAQSVQPSATKFEFESPGDGEYWFAVRTLDAQNQLYPQTPTTEPGLKVVVDTLQPLLQINLQQLEPGKVELSWVASDPHLDLSTLKLEYIQPGLDDWQPVNVTAEATGRTSWSVPQSGFVGVRGSVSDLASNVGSAEQQVRIDAAPSSGMKPSSAIDFREPIAQGKATPIAQSTSVPQVLHQPGGQPIAQAQPIAQHAPASDPSIASPLGTNPLAPSIPPEFSSQGNQLAASDQGSGWGTNLVSDVPEFRPSVLQDRYPSGGATPGLRVVNTTKFQISYKIEEVGPSGVGSVELFITDDDGRKWYKYGTDPDNASPYEVEVPREGNYGFDIRVRSGQGVAADPPQPGDKPPIVVVVDKSPPVAQLISAQQGTGAALNKVLIRWSASDDYPAERPIQLSYAIDSEGPWEPICDWQANSGNYIWTLPAGVPAKLYVRLTARDAAGNISRVDTPQPVLIDMSKPTARIVDIEVLDGGSRF